MQDQEAGELSKNVDAKLVPQKTDVRPPLSKPPKSPPPKSPTAKRPPPAQCELQLMLGTTEHEESGTQIREHFPNDPDTPSKRRKPESSCSTPVHQNTSGETEVLPIRLFGGHPPSSTPVTPTAGSGAPGLPLPGVGSSPAARFPKDRFGAPLSQGASASLPRRPSPGLTGSLGVMVANPSVSVASHSQEGHPPPPPGLAPPDLEAALVSAADADPWSSSSFAGSAPPDLFDAGLGGGTSGVVETNLSVSVASHSQEGQPPPPPGLAPPGLQAPPGLAPPPGLEAAPVSSSSDADPWSSSSLLGSEPPTDHLLRRVEATPSPSPQSCGHDPSLLALFEDVFGGEGSGLLPSDALLLSLRDRGLPSTGGNLATAVAKVFVKRLGVVLEPYSKVYGPLGDEVFLKVEASEESKSELEFFEEQTKKWMETMWCKRTMFLKRGT